MISRFFIDRPIFAAVLSIVITLTGGIALLYLPIAQYPRVTPPGVNVSISYPGASAQEVADAVGAPIEQQVNGVEGMLYMSSQSGNDGSYSLTVTFDIGTDLKAALVKVQNRVALAMPQLPTAVQNQGITIRKRTPDMLLIVNFISPNGTYDDKYLSNFATIYAKDELLRVEGISDINIQGQRDYSMRIWLDPQKLAAHSVTVMDVAAAIRSQNIDAPAGRVGQPPIASGQSSQIPLDTVGRISDPEQFGDIIVKVGGTTPILSPTGMVAQPATTTDSTSAPTPMTMPATGTTTTIPTTDTTTTDPSTSTTTTPMAAPASVTPLPNVLNPLVNPAQPLTGGSVGTTSLAGGAFSNGGNSPVNSILRLRDVARIELGAQNYNTICSFDGKPSVGLGLFQLPGTNALDVADRVRNRMKELKASFPDDVDYIIAYDTTTYIRDSVNDVIRTLIEAVALVGIVVLIFLQSWRATLIPLTAVPVAIIGTFGVMAAMGFSLNNISLFGLVLAIGIVVDDAIVVVENVERWLDRGYNPVEATRRAMDEVTGPIVAVGLVLCAVFVPCAFISGITGQFFRQFAVTIAVSTVFSTFNSLTFSPALAAILLKPRHAIGMTSRRPDFVTVLLNAVLGWFFWIFNRVFGAGTNGYAWLVGKLMRAHLLVLLGYIGLLFLTVWTFRQAPTGFIPQQDQGRLIVNLQLPDSTALEQTHEAVLLIEKIARGDKDDPEHFPGVPGVGHTVTNSGLSFLLQSNSPNFASMFVVLKPFKDRQEPHLRDTVIMNRLRKAWSENKRLRDLGAQATVFGAAPVPGLGVAGGFKFLVEDRGGLGVRSLQEQMDGLVARFKELPQLTGATTQFRATIPQLYADIDRTKVASMGVSLSDVTQTLGMYLGSLYVNSYNDFGRHWQVTIQADGKYRTRPENIDLFQVRNQAGQMVPLSSLVKMRPIGGPITVTRYNLYTSASISGNIQAGGSTGEAIKAINQLADDTLPRTMRIEWTELMFMQLRAGNTAIYVFILAVISVFMALAALYESWSLPLAVILVVPLCLLCSVAGVLYTGRDVNIFVQIGLVVLVGLACKNAILIVEFAKELHDRGQSCYEATREASRLRLRPILMTSLAFIFGVVPLVFASGAGAEMRRSLGTAVFSGMLGVTLFGIFLTPVFFFVIQGLGESRLFTSPRNRAVFSYTISATLGGLVGFSLARLDLVLFPWGPIVGAMVGILVIRAIRGVQVRVRESNGKNPPAPNNLPPGDPLP